MSLRFDAIEDEMPALRAAQAGLGSAAMSGRNRMDADDIREHYPVGVTVYATPSNMMNFPRSPRVGIVVGYSRDGQRLRVRRGHQVSDSAYDPIYWDLRP